MYVWLCARDRYYCGSTADGGGLVEVPLGDPLQQQPRRGRRAMHRMQNAQTPTNARGPRQDRHVPHTPPEGTEGGSD